MLKSPGSREVSLPFHTAVRSGRFAGYALSYRDVEELLAERGLDISYETVRCWVLKFGPVIARRLRRCRPRPR